MTKITRQLAAIMFSDIAGYSALMQENEEQANAFRDKYKSETDSAVSIHNGKVLQYYGDGSLSIFSSAIEAVKCAVKIQLKMMDEPKVNLRIGLHMGDILFDEDGVYGDSVNIASRIESLSVPGAVLVSEKVYDEIKNQPDLPSVSLGSFELKNIKRPLEVHAIKTGRLVIPKKDDIKGKLKENAGSIAVLPFLNMSSDPDNEYFSDGISEELINALTRATGLHVISRTSSFTFKGKKIGVIEIGKKLNVSKVLEGSVRKAGNKVRITAQLTDTSNGYHLWSETYNREMKDIFELQDEISEAILRKFDDEDTDIHITKPLFNQNSVNVDAYNLYLKAHYEYFRGGSKIIDSIKLFEQAIAIEPMYALAHAALSTCYSYGAKTGSLNYEIALEKAYEHAKKAIEIDDKNPTSHLAMTIIKKDFENDWEGAYNECMKMLELYPGNSSLHSYCGVLLSQTGRYSEGINELLIAIELDPLSTSFMRNLASTYDFAGYPDKSLQLEMKMLELDPEHELTYSDIAHSYIELGETLKAIEYIDKAEQLSGKKDCYAAAYGFAYARAGDKEKAMEYIEKIQQSEKKLGVITLFNYANIYGGLKDYDKMFYYLNKAADLHIDISYFLHLKYYRDEVGKDPRYLHLKKRMNLDKYEFGEI